MKTWETEKVHEIWNNVHGEHFEIGKDRDGLDMVEIRSFGPDCREPDARISFPRAVAVEVARIITEEYGEPVKPAATDSQLLDVARDWMRWFADENATSGDRDAADQSLIEAIKLLDTGAKD